MKKLSAEANIEYVEHIDEEDIIFLFTMRV